MNIADKRIRNLVITVLAVLAFFLLVQSVSAIVSIKEKRNMMPNNMITVRGTGEAIGTPDIATFTVTIQENNKDVATAQQAMTEKANKAVDYLKQQGIEEKDIKTISYTTEPQYDYNVVNMGVARAPQLVGYTASESFSVKVRDTAKAGEILTHIASLQIGTVSTLSFTIDDPESLKVEAKEEAIKKARAEADRIAKALGVRLERVVSFYEEYPYEGPMGYGADMSVSSVRAQNAMVAPKLQAGEEKVTATVSVSYEVEN
jgi:uncharacterized protein YggE